MGLGAVLSESKQFAAAEQAIQRAMEIEPEIDAGHDLAKVYLLEGKAAAALATYRSIKHAENDVFRLTGEAMAEHSLGHEQASQQALQGLIAARARSGAFQIAEVYAWRGEKDLALNWLERGYQQHDGGLMYLKSDLLIASVRGDPRYAALLARMGLPAD